MKSQEKRILSHLKQGHSITPLQALKWFDCLRLGARIYDLIGQGHNIKSTMVDVGNGKRVARYAMDSGK